MLSPQTTTYDVVVASGMGVGLCGLIHYSPTQLCGTYNVSRRLSTYKTELFVKTYSACMDVKCNVFFKYYRIIKRVNISKDFIIYKYIKLK